jgi:hypothetical protein
VPFNLRLVTDLLTRARVPGSKLRDIDAQVGLLDAYWRARVLQPLDDAEAREQVLDVATGR